MFNFFSRKPSRVNELITSELYNENTFYIKFILDLLNCSSEIIIESPYISLYRMRRLFPIFSKLVSKGIKIYIITRLPMEHTDNLGPQAELEIQRFEKHRNSGIAM
jgi:hypothetical protein